MSKIQTGSDLLEKLTRLQVRNGVTGMFEVWKMADGDLVAWEEVKRELVGKVVVPEKPWTEIQALIGDLQDCEDCGLLCDWNGCPNKKVIKNMRKAVEE